jgi:subtilisin-like proprotein convertase family protein
MSHTYPADVDVLLVGPGGQKAMIFSDVGGGGDMNNVTVTLSDAAATALTASGQIVSGTYKPTNIEPGEHGELDTFSTPAPGGPYTASLSVFNGLTADGAWSLYVVDDSPKNRGSFAGGWSLTITTVSSGPQAPTITSISDDVIDEDSATGALSFTIGDADTPVQSLSVSGSSSNPALVPNGNIVFGGSGSNRTVTVTPAANANGSATITVNVSDGTATTTDTFVLTVNAVNDAPRLDSIASLIIPRDAALQTVALSGISSGPVNELQVLTVSAVSSNPGLIPNPTVSYSSPDSTGSLGFTPVAEASGSAVITVTVQDDGGTLDRHDTAAQIFTVTVLSPPVLHISLSGTSVLISFATVSGVTYVVEYKNPLNDTVWTRLSTESRPRNTGTAIRSRMSGLST